MVGVACFFFFFSSRRRHTRFDCDWSSDVCSSDLETVHRPTCTPVRTRTLSTLFAASRPAGFGVDSPGFEPVYWLPRYTVPPGAVIVRSRSFTRHTLHPAVPGKSVHTRVTSTD